ncbi:hypothetical protein [Halostagnicola sp. A-GB9-2]|uniref:hypothetical protein n=1 Tax=Halostagnicola sp. A-GB9-2 TaxID=3048066 RepID=UPI0024BFB1D7|nr:hypothetical protein [Halostagnicola sp. A-GB9-2]MDJ1434484.1 hypothetical protein [Halostagnicola sp. A-GB9-2]
MRLVSIADISTTRRRFCTTSLATVGGVSVAGCLGGVFSDPDPADGSGGVTDPEEWIDGDEIHLLGYARHWEGVKPADLIDGVENPTLVLEARSTYEISWENAEDMRHNLEI